MRRPPIFDLPVPPVYASGHWRPQPHIDHRHEDTDAGETLGVDTTGAAPPAADELRVLQEVCDWLEDAIGTAAQCHDTTALLQHTRDRALLLMLFWRRVSAAQLLGVRAENVHLTAMTGVSCKFMSAQGPRRISWYPIAVPALKPLCPVAALRLWLSVSGLRCGPLFPRIKHGGDLADEGLPPDSVLPLLLGLVALSRGEAPRAAT